MRPDRVHGVCATADDGQTLIIHEDPGFPGEGRRALRAVSQILAAEGRSTIVLCGNVASVLGRPEARVSGGDGIGQFLVEVPGR